MDSNSALNSWKNRIEAGDRNIALSNVGHIASQQKYLLAMLTYFGMEKIHHKKNIGLVSFDLKTGLYKDHFQDYYPIEATELSAPNKMGSHFIDWNLLIQKKIPVEMLDKFDLLLWDLPDLNFINSNSHILERFFKEFDSMLIVSMRPNGIGDNEYIGRIQSFYKNHGLALPNVFVNSEKKEDKKIKVSEKIRRLIGL